MLADREVLDFTYSYGEAMLPADAHCHEKGCSPSAREFAEGSEAMLKADALLGFGAIDMRNDDEPWLVRPSDRLCSELGWRSSNWAR
jgi:hypothetical protein